MASGMSWLGWHRSNLGLRQGAMNMHNPSVTLLGKQPYFPGESIQGKASWGFKNKVTVKDTKLSVNGACKVKWAVGFGENKLTFEANHAYFDVLVFNDGNTDESLLNTEHHEISFDVTLPEDIPSSFQSKYGNIWYSVCLVASYSDGRFTYNETFNYPFQVINPYRPIAPVGPITLAAVENHGLCGHKDVIKFELATNKNFYNPGEIIEIDGFVDNRSKKKLSVTKLVLTQRITYTVTSEQSQHGETRSRSEVVATWIGGEVKSASKVVYEKQETLLIPSVSESEMKHCQAIDTEYTLKFGVKLPGIFSRELFSDSEVIYIGNSQIHKSEEMPLAPKRSVSVLMKDGSFMRL